MYDSGGSTCKYKVIDNMVIVEVTVAASSGEINMGTLPTDLHPATRVNEVFEVRQSGSTIITAGVFVSDSGAVKAYNQHNIAESGSVTYFI